MHRQRNYANPPVVEALCDIRFAPGQEWDWTIPGLLYAELQGDFPQKEQTEAIAVRVEQGLAPQQVPSRRLRFFNEERTTLIQVGEDTLVVNCLRPYIGWHNFRPMIASALEKYRSIAKPAGVASCSLRYINKIEFAERTVVIEDYLNTYPQMPANLPDHVVGWSLTLDVPAPSGLMRLQAGATSPEEGRAFIIDLRFIAVEPEKLDLAEALLQWIDGAHDIIEQTFEASITDKTRELFHEISEKEVAHDRLAIG